MYTVYKYTNVDNGKVYIGMTGRSLEDRAGENGFNYIYYNKDGNLTKFAGAILYHGWSKFKGEVLASTEDIQIARFLESYYIFKFDSYRSGYNSTIGAFFDEISPKNEDLNFYIDIVNVNKNIPSLEDIQKTRHFEYFNKTTNTDSVYRSFETLSNNGSVKKLLRYAKSLSDAKFEKIVKTRILDNWKYMVKFPEDFDFNLLKR